MADIKIKKLHEDAILPSIGSKWAAGYDLYACIPKTPIQGNYNPQRKDIVIFPHTTEKVSTELAFDIPTNYWGGIFARSGLATKQGLRPANCVGVIDPDYRGPIIVAIHNDSDDVKVIRHGDRIAQFVLMPRVEINFSIVDELSNTERGAAGFGSTGK